STAGMWPLLVARTVSTTLFAVMAIAGGRSLRMPAQVTALVIFAGVMDMLANALYVLATRQGPLSIVVTLSSLYPASTVLLARLAQFHPLEEALTAMGVVVWAMIELEADDALASAAQIASGDQRVEKVCIWTPDKDLAQCVRGDRVVQVDRKGKTIRNAAGV